MKNLRWILCLLTIILALKSQGQSKFTFGLNSSYLVGNRVFTYHGFKDFIDYRNQEERYKIGMDITGTVRYKIKDRISLETGIGYSNIGYQTKEYKFNDPETAPGFASVLYVFNYNNINLPFHLNYSSKGKCNFNISLGPSLVFLLSEDIDVILRKQYGNSAGQTLSDYPFDEIENNIKKVNTSIDLGFGMGYRLTNKINIEIQPKISYFLFPNENEWAREYLYYLQIFSKQNRSTRENLYSTGISLKISFNP